ncbi:hypothetical protein [Brevibacillus brevis]|uniref:hypothetical protein n=1 Tax=Brevibacillus brevis TaxID=1393 RepID=UPI00115BC5E6|nr:hypothetical protein [Lysinibacillus sp. SDF0063]TQR35752.1 hypothetical protein C7Y45_15600 [Lysinibacillus sp. SDF0063]
MKKWFGVITLSAFLLAISSACSTKESTHSSSGFALSKTFSSTEEITQDAMLILKGTVPTFCFSMVVMMKKLVT